MLEVYSQMLHGLREHREKMLGSSNRYRITGTGGQISIWQHMFAFQDFSQAESTFSNLRQCTGYIFVACSFSSGNEPHIFKAAMLCMVL